MAGQFVITRMVDSALCQEILNVPETQAEPMVEPHGVGDDLAGITMATVGIPGRFHPQIMPTRRDRSST